eukprot:CAMPEP_0201678046 /NCGR_PEP_ID=MMETSP0494-20130426/45444_1 /ASSEMBLY_ACC=CAM_ASM_000839 /TAXON_ID=420259 /ORGANISM="Thalassiosira gravida, Strain GMp14c1" /LENGTH=72 /DNA_ID=CAMNT_0048161137 /DNA_START=78 /DNA_END=293 /DNA_ORIENTATION=+
MKATSKHAMHYWLSLLAIGATVPSTACPFAKKGNGDAAPSLPDDEIHRRSLRRRLSDTVESKDKVQAIIDNR